MNYSFELEEELDRESEEDEDKEGIEAGMIFWKGDRIFFGKKGKRSYKKDYRKS